MQYKYIILFLLLIPVFIFRDYTPDNELKYISIARDALAQGHFFTFYDHGEIYADKPPLYLWVIMILQNTFGHVSPSMMSFFSIIPAYVTLLIMDKWTRDYINQTERLMAAFMLMTTAYFLGASLTIRMDMLMTMFILLALHCFYSIYTGKYIGTKKWLFPIYIFLAIFTKGPIGFIIPVVSVILFLISKKETRLIKDYLGIRQIGIIILLIAIWFIAVYAEGSYSYLHNLAIKQTLGRSVNAFTHKQPFYYYLGTMWYAFAPWIFFYVGILYLMIKRRLIKTDIQRLFIITIGSAFLIMSIISSKLEIYLLPVYPLVTYLSITVFNELKNNKWIKASVIIPALLLTLVLPIYFILGYKIIPRELIGDWKVIAAITSLCITNIIAIFLIVKQKNLIKAINWISYGVLTFIFIGSFSISQINHDIGYKELNKEAEVLSRDRSLIYYHYKSHNMDYMDVYSDHSVYEIDSLKDLQRLAKNNNYLLIINNKTIRQEKELKKFISTRERHQIGESIIVMINRNFVN